MDRAHDIVIVEAEAKGADAAITSDDQSELDPRATSTIAALLLLRLLGGGLAAMAALSHIKHCDGWALLIHTRQRRRSSSSATIRHVQRRRRLWIYATRLRRKLVLI